MKVLQLIDSLNVGGAERMTVNYANSLIKKLDYAAICVTREEGLLKKIISPNVIYLFLKRQRTLDFKAIKKLNTFIREHEIKILHAHSTSFFIATIMKIYNRDIKLIWHDHNGNRLSTPFFNKIILKACSFFFDKIITVDKRLKMWSDENLFSKTVYYLPNFSIINNKEENTHLLGENDKRIICLANLRYPKNHKLLIKAFKLLNDKNKEWTLHLIGEDFHDEYSDKLKDMIIKYELDNNIFIYGKCIDINYILSQCSIGVLSSQSEGFPLALLEYGLARLAVVSTNVGDCNKLISNPSEGILIQPNDVKTLYEVMFELINDSEKRDRLGVNLNKKITEEFSEEILMNKLIEIYQN